MHREEEQVIMPTSTRIVINGLLETLSMLQITHGDKDEEWFVGRYWNDDPGKRYYSLCTTGRNR